jgi:hypothetical protein
MHRGRYCHSDSLAIAFQPGLEQVILNGHAAQQLAVGVTGQHHDQRPVEFGDQRGVPAVRLAHRCGDPPHPDQGVVAQLGVLGPVEGPPWSGQMQL